MSSLGPVNGNGELSEYLNEDGALRSCISLENTSFELPLLPFEVLGRSGSPGTICVFGPCAQPVLAAGQGDVVIAAARYGLGRVVAISHEGYIENAAQIQSGPELLYCLTTWAGGPLGRVPRVGCLGHALSWLAERLHEAGLGELVEVVEWEDNCDVVIWIGETGSGDVCESTVDISTTLYGQLLPFMERGGGLIVAMCPWGFEQVCSSICLRA
jgi:hypothetical protein